MKINSVKKAQKTSQKRVSNQPQPVTPFSDVMAVTEENQERSHLDDMMDDIRKKGRELSQKKEVEILVEYKEMVKDFIDQAVNFGLKVMERRGYGRAGRSKVMRMVSMIDAKMIDLTEDLLRQEAAGLKLLTKIGEIEGLLLNLYA